MVKRLKDIAASNDSNLAETVKESAQQIWLAGMGAFAKAQEEGTKVFEALVKEGKGLEAKTRNMTNGRVGEMTEQMNKAAQAATSKANAAWDKLEQVFLDRVERANKRLGVATSKEIAALTREVAELSAAVKTLKPRSRASAAKAPATKAAAKKK